MSNFSGTVSAKAGEQAAATATAAQPGRRKQEIRSPHRRNYPL
jgi:hypothetical protein